MGRELLGQEPLVAGGQSGEGVEEAARGLDDACGTTHARRDKSLFWRACDVRPRCLAASVPT